VSIRRRQFITLLGGAAAWPLAAGAQQRAMPVIGWLESAGPSSEKVSAAVRRGLQETGYVEGRNVAIEYVSAEGRYDRLPALVADLVCRQVSVIYIPGGTPATLAAKAATATIPIVFNNGSDPVALGLVRSMNRPGGNVTGVSFLSDTILPKRLELLRELVPQAATIAFLVNQTNSIADGITAEVEQAAHKVGQRIAVFRASTAEEIDTAFMAMVREGVGAVVIGQDVFFYSQRDQLVSLAARHMLPAVYFLREMVEAGGLMSYGDDRADSFRQAGIYIGRILRGESPSDLPVLQPTKFELVINLKAAKAIGLTVPPLLLTFADEVIE
jgi:putative tryptophan/tyrosine transport system substrate-binding protein